MPRRRLSQETREGIVRAYHQFRPITDIAQFYDANESTIRSFLARYRQDGAVSRPQGGRRHVLLQDRHLNWLADELDNYGDRTIDALRQGLVEQFPEDFGARPPSSTTVWRAVTNTIRYRLKAQRVEPAKLADFNSTQTINDRADWCEALFHHHLDLRNCVFIDENRFDLQISTTSGRAPVGSRPIAVNPSARASSLTLVVAMSAHGILASDLVQGSFDGDAFSRFVRTKVLPALQKPELVMMPSTAVHRTPAIRDAFAHSHHRFQFLPPYSHALNAAKWVFACLKPRCARKDFKGLDTFRDMIASTLAAISSQQCREWLAAVNGNCIKALRKEALSRDYLNSNSRSLLSRMESKPRESQQDRPTAVRTPSQSSTASTKQRYHYSKTHRSRPRRTAPKYKPSQAKPGGQDPNRATAPPTITSPPPPNPGPTPPFQH